MLEVQSLHAGYGGTPILDGIEFSVGKGEIVAIIGRNGVGKTTLMKCLIGLLSAKAGAIQFNGLDVTREPANHRAQRGIGYIPQGREVFPRLTVEENLLMGRLISQHKPTKLEDMVYRYFPVLRERRKQKAGTMSGGEQQQLAIGRALIGNPDLLLLDEPSEGIQPSIVQKIGANVRELNREINITVLFVEQNVDMITHMAQRCYVMDKGRIVDEVAPQQLANPDVVRRYLAV
ncbi:MAG: urea ABC transporter ATP-binding subunit UrtE [Gammaproteobacteria bacterium]